MSGWVNTGWGPAFDLTATKADYWHRRCSCGSPMVDLDWLRRTHIEPSGIKVIPGPSANLLRCLWEGATVRRSTDGTDVLYAAVTGGSWGS